MISCRKLEQETPRFNALLAFHTTKYLDHSLQNLEQALLAVETVPKLKFSKDYLQRLTKPIPKKDPNMQEKAPSATFSEPRHPTGFQQYCMSCGKEQLFSVDTLGWKTCTVCRRTAPDRSQSPV